LNPLQRKEGVKSMNIAPEIENRARRAAIAPDIFRELLSDLAPQNRAAGQRGESFQALLWLCRNQPHLVYSHWDFFVSMLESDNSFAIFNAVYIIAALIKHDADGKFDRIAASFIGRLNHRTVMVSGHAALNLGRIAAARPDLEPQITQALLGAASAVPDRERQDIFKGYIIEAFTEYYHLARQPREIREFVRSQLNCANLKTSNLAREFFKDTRRRSPINPENGGEIR
jgi:hypothetical protein